MHFFSLKRNTDTNVARWYSYNGYDDRLVIKLPVLLLAISLSSSYLPKSYTTVESWVNAPSLDKKCHSLPVNGHCTWSMTAC